MRTELLLFFCLACLALTAQAAPTAIEDALHRDYNGGKHTSKQKHHRHDHEKHHHGKKPGHPDRSRKTTRAVNSGEIHAADEAASHLFRQEHLLPKYRDKLAAAEAARREENKLKLHQMQVEDAIYMAKYGKTPPKFPLITRIASTIGLSSAAFNVVNFLFSAKTTALATDQFSAPPTPPTLIDTAARWDGSQYKLMPMPEESAEKGASDKRKRSLERRSSHRLLKRGISEATRVASDDPKMAKRWVVSSIVGAGLGAAFSPGFTSALMNKKADVDAPPFDPYDPKMIKPKDPFVAAAATTDQPLPALQMSDSRTRSRSSTPPVLGDVVFPEQTTAARGQDRGSSRSNLAIDRSSSSSSDTSESTNSGDTTPVLRKRSLESNSELKKRFFFSGGSWGKVSGALTVGSVVPLIYSGVSHARWRTYNPRDRDILKDLDDTPTYGAVGVPGRQPGQLATNAMPGYRNYVAQLEQQQAQTQPTSPQPNPVDTARQVPEREKADLASNDDGLSTGGNADPILRRRDVDRHDDARVEKRGNLLAAGGLAAFGLALGYAQSATQFPTDRDEERDAKKRKMKKAQQEMMAQQQQQAMMQGGQASPGASDSSNDPLASIPTKPLPGMEDGGASQIDPLAGVPEKPLPGSDAEYGARSGDSGSGSGYGGDSADSSSSRSSSSLSDSLNAAAGYRASSSSSSRSGSVLKKRDASLSKRTPGLGSAMSIGGTAMFFGTLAGNLFVASKQKHKPVPIVTPNADTRGPMIPGGDLYTAYLESKRGPTVGAGAANDAVGGVRYGLSSVLPADVSRGAAVQNAASLAGARDSSPGGVGGGLSPVGAESGSTQDATSDDEGAGGDPVLKKRHRGTLLEKRAPLAFAAAAEAETAGALLTKAPALMEAEAGLASALGRGAASEAGTGAASLLGKGATASEAGAGAASRLGSAGRLGGLGGEAASTSGSAGRLGGLSRYEGRVSTLGRGVAASENGLYGLARTSPLAAEASALRPLPATWGSARPAMVSDAAAVGGEGVPATIEDVAKAEGKGKGMGWKKAMGIVSAGAGASMTFNGPGR